MKTMLVLYPSHGIIARTCISFLNTIMSALFYPLSSDETLNKLDNACFSLLTIVISKQTIHANVY